MDSKYLCIRPHLCKEIWKRNNLQSPCLCKPPLICCGKKSKQGKSRKKATKTHCGVINNIIEPRIMFSDNNPSIVTRTGDSPWTLALFKVKESDRDDSRFICSATLLGARVAVTVNHNFPLYEKFEPGSYLVRSGTLEIEDSEDDGFMKHQDRIISKVIIFNIN